MNKWVTEYKTNPVVMILDEEPTSSWIVVNKAIEYDKYVFIKFMEGHICEIDTGSILINAAIESVFECANLDYIDLNRVLLEGYDQISIKELFCLFEFAVKANRLNHALDLLNIICLKDKNNTLYGLITSCYVSQ